MGNRLNFNDQWRVKLEGGQTKGPFSTEALCKMLIEGILTGQEDVAKYPGDEWRSFSRQKEFYEALLESLENPVERDEKKAQKMDAETVIQTAPIIGEPEKSEDQQADEFKELIKNLAEGNFKNRRRLSMGLDL